jgi:ribosome-associated protein
MVRITPEIALPDGEVAERFVPLATSRAEKRGHEVSGVELRLDITKASLPENARTRLLALTRHRVTSQGVLLVVSRTHRSQHRNRMDAYAHLSDIIRAALMPRAERLPAVRPKAGRSPRTTGRAHGALRRAVTGDLS